MDNFEWQKGCGTTFGIIAADRMPRKSTPKPGLAILGGYAEY